MHLDCMPFKLQKKNNCSPPNTCEALEHILNFRFLFGVGVETNLDRFAGTGRVGLFSLTPGLQGIVIAVPCGFLLSTRWSCWVARGHRSVELAAIYEGLSGLNLTSGPSKHLGWWEPGRFTYKFLSNRSPRVFIWSPRPQQHDRHESLRIKHAKGCFSVSSFCPEEKKLYIYIY